MGNQSNEVVIGIDGGGTHTRVMVADLQGNVLSYVKKGASFLHKDANAKQNVHQAIQEALQQAGKSPSQVKQVTAGIAGYDSPSDEEWVTSLTAVPGLHCPKEHVNDTVVAHSGALLTKPGIIIISGTGSNIYAVTETGEQIRNYDLCHYAASAARFLAYDATFELLAGNIDETDQALAAAILSHWEQTSVAGLAELARVGFIEDQRERNRRFAQLAPVITEAAFRSSRLAQTVCDRAIHQIAVGIEMLAAYFASEEVKLSFIGSVINSDYFRQRLSSTLQKGKNKQYRIVNPAFSPVAGAVLQALSYLHIPIHTDVLHNLSLHPCSKMG